jgi:hypothetical protein
MPSTLQIIEWTMSGNGRLAAAGLLFVVMWALQSVPAVKAWLSVDSGKLTSGRKEAIATVVLAMAPAALALSQGKPAAEVLAVAIGAATGASGIGSLGKSALGK